MAHIVVEYSANLRGQFDLDGLLKAVHEAALATGVFPIGGLRTRAYEAQHYVIADANPDNAFIHINLKVGHGRDLPTRKRAGEAVFAVACQQLSALSERLPLGIALDMQEIDPVLTFKKNNLHEYVKQRAARKAAHS
jgi:5-carboxymethyl-2-hydroxymuconate isomerase